MLIISFKKFDSIYNILCLLVSVSIVTFLVLGVGEAELLELSPSSGDIQRLQSDELHELCLLERFQSVLSSSHSLGMTVLIKTRKCRTGQGHCSLGESLSLYLNIFFSLRPFVVSKTCFVSSNTYNNYGLLRSAK